MSSVSVDVTHSVLAVTKRKTFALDTPLSKVKDAVYMIVGTAPAHMKLQVLDADGKHVADITADDSAPLSTSGIVDGQRLHVVDTAPEKIDFLVADAAGSVEKKEMSKEEYAKRDNTFLKWRQQQIAAQKQQPAAAATGAVAADAVVTAPQHPPAPTAAAAPADEVEEF